MGRIVALTLSLAILAAAGVGGWFGWHYFEAERRIQAQEKVIDALGRRLDRVWQESLVADLKVNAVKRDKKGDPTMDLTFVQYAPGTEQPIFRRHMDLPGTEVYVDALVVKFDRPLVEAGDGLRGHSLLLFRRAFGDRQRPVDGVPLWAPDKGPVPRALEVDAAGQEAFERKVWQTFWRYANDPKAAKKAGIRVAEGQAPHVKVAVGQVYELTLRASGGLDIVPRLPAALVGTPAPDVHAPAPH